MATEQPRPNYNLRITGGQLPPELADLLSRISRGKVAVTGVDLEDTGIAGLLGTLFGIPSQRRRPSEPSFGYKEFPTLREREVVFNIGKKFAEYAHDNGIDVMIYPDSSARLIRNAVSGYWRSAYPDEKPPESYYVNPQAVQTKEDVIKRLKRAWNFTVPEDPIPEAFSVDAADRLPPSRILELFASGTNINLSDVFPSMDARIALYDVIDTIPELTSKEIARYLRAYGARYNDMVIGLVQIANYGIHLQYVGDEASSFQRFSSALSGVAKDTQRKAMIVDTCIHSGKVIEPIKRNLTTLGYEDVKIGIVAGEYNTSTLVPDVVVYEVQPVGDGACHPLPTDTLTQKEIGNPISVRVDELGARRHGINTRQEIARIMREHQDFSLRDDATAVDKLAQRANEQKPLDVLCIDLDGTLYVRTQEGTYIGNNEDTRRQVEAKNIPVIVNTARPDWGLEDDQDIVEEFGFALPDVVISGNGTSIKWRGKDGIMRDDTEYLNLLRNHEVTYRSTGETQKYDGLDLGQKLNPILRGYLSSGLNSGLPDGSPRVSDGTFGLFGIRLEVEDMSYDVAKRLIADVTDEIGGVKLEISEVASATSADAFSGWIHIVPSIAGKERALRHVLSKLKEEGRELPGITDKTINAHVFGDGSVDISMLAMGSSEARDGYIAKQYGLANMPYQTRRRLDRVAPVANNGRARSPLTRQAHLQILDQVGPDAIHQVVSALV